MIASNIDRSTLEHAARKVGVRIRAEATSSTGRRWSVKVDPDPAPELYTPSGRRRSGKAGDAKYQRITLTMEGDERRCNAVCWHGFRDFFRACFEVEPEARFYTALDKWLGSDDFEARFPATGHRNIGPPIAPVPIADACRCPERGMAR